MRSLQDSKAAANQTLHPTSKGPATIYAMRRVGLGVS
jgi:hypothetical protein